MRMVTQNPIEWAATHAIYQIRLLRTFDGHLKYWCRQLFLDIASKQHAWGAHFRRFTQVHTYVHGKVDWQMRMRMPYIMLLLTLDGRLKLRCHQKDNRIQTTRRTPKEQCFVSQRLENLVTMRSTENANDGKRNLSYRKTNTFDSIYSYSE